MADKVVMGDQQDGLRGLTRFSDNEGEIIWPAWRAELKQRVSFEFGKIGNQIIEGEVKEEDVDHGEVTADINSLINSLIPKTRAQIQTRSDWMQELVVSSGSLRVLKSQESADVLRNLLGEGGSGDAMDDVCRGFECFNDMKHTIMQLPEGIEDCADKIRTLLGEHEQEPECMQAKIIVPKIITGDQ